MLKIGGYQKTTLLDYPGKLAATIFLGSCQFRCPFCHNSELFSPEELYDEDEILAMLRKRRGILDGVAITGGEPTLSPELPDFMRKLKDMGFLVKLDSNGYKPDTLRSIVEAGLADYVAMDIKSAPSHYGEVAGLPELDISRIRESVSFLMGSGIDYEFRTTVVPELHGEDDFEEIADWLSGPSKYYLQAFKDSEMVHGGRFSQPSPALMEHLLEIVRPKLPNAEIRGIEE